MKIGFTGTRDGMTLSQLTAFSALTRRLELTEFHHGDCVGADDEAAHDVATCLTAKIISHPPLDNTHRAFNQDWLHQLPPLTHFARNRAIVDATDGLIAATKYMGPIDKTSSGGTAYTIQYARKKGKPIWVVRPDGEVEYEDPTLTTLEFGG